LEYLTINTGSNISILITYIVFVTKLQKRQTLKNGSALLKNDITTSERLLGLQIHSSNHWFWVYRRYQHGWIHQRSRVLCRSLLL